MQKTILHTELMKLGQSLTKPRQAVFDALHSNGPMTTSELIVQLKGIDRASVYRTVSLFESIGFIRKVSYGWKYKIELSDVFTAHHHHLRCTECGKIVDLKDDVMLVNVLSLMAQSTGFKNLTHEIEVSGICPDCS